ncbi:MAG TPA: hypothetical protein VH439_17230 [Gemmatimonadales bacterium]|jgi:hypothetical protein
MTTTTTTLPLYLLNGSDPASVAEAMQDAAHAASDLAGWLAKCGPHMRDYTSVPDDYARARAEFTAHVANLRGILEYLQAHAMHAADAADARGAR